MYDRPNQSSTGASLATREPLRNAVEPNPDTVEARIMAFDKLLSHASLAFHERLGEAVRRLENKMEPILSPTPPMNDGATGQGVSAVPTASEPVHLAVRLDMRLQRLGRFIDSADRAADYINGLADRVQL